MAEVCGCRPGTVNSQIADGVTIVIAGHGKIRLGVAPICDLDAGRTVQIEIGYWRGRTGRKTKNAVILTSVTVEIHRSVDAKLATDLAIGEIDRVHIYVAEMGPKLCDLGRSDRSAAGDRSRCATGGRKTN